MKAVATEDQDQIGAKADCRSFGFVLATRLGAPELHQLHASPDNIGERLFFQGRHKIPLRVGQYVLERTSTGDRAGVGAGIKAFDEIEVRLTLAHHFPEVDLFRGLRQLQATIATTSRFDEPVLNEQPSDFAQVVRRDSVRSTDIEHRWEALPILGRMMSQIEEYAQRVISELG